jgi:hypothetical protein
MRHEKLILWEISIHLHVLRQPVAIIGRIDNGAKHDQLMSKRT